MFFFRVSPPDTLLIMNLHQQPILLIVLAASARLLLTQAACPPDGCGPYGQCIRGTFCDCNLDYDGDDCSIPIEICPGPVVPDALTVNNNGDLDEKEATSCLNGGMCVAQDVIDATTGEKKLEWRCDCSTAIGEAASSSSSSSSSSSAFAGYRCEFPAATSCVVTDNIASGKMSTYSFCVNKGSCIQMIKQGEEHPGCGCGPAFEGRHCQYLQGTAPAEELDFAQQQVNDSENNVGMSGLQIFFVIGMCLIFVSIVGYLMFVHHKRTKSQAVAATTEGVNSTREMSLNEPSTATATETAAEAVYMEAMKNNDLKLQEDTEKDDYDSSDEPKNELI